MGSLLLLLLSDMLEQRVREQAIKGATEEARRVVVMAVCVGASKQGAGCRVVGEPRSVSK